MKTVMLLAAAALTATMAGAALAQSGTGQGQMGRMGQGWVMQYCKAEIARYCGDLQHGRGEIPVCLAKHRDDLSPDCRAALDNKGPGWGRPNAPVPAN